MADAVEWQADGAPGSSGCDAVAASRWLGFERAARVLLQGCGLPQGWSNQPQWHILETGFGLGLNFLAAWRLWQDDPQRPRILHYSAVQVWPPAAADRLRGSQSLPALAALAEQLASQWFGLVPGLHRFEFEQGRVLLTLLIGELDDLLREQTARADSVFWDSDEPRHNPPLRDQRSLKALARCCRIGAGIAAASPDPQLRLGLGRAGFVLATGADSPSPELNLHGVFAPAWTPKGRLAKPRIEPGQCVVIGAGLAGAGAAASLARRGWKVLVLDAAQHPAAGASGVPAGLLTSQVSPDDNLLSRLSRGGVRATLLQARWLLQEGQDWQGGGVLEHRVGAGHDSAAGLPATAWAWSRPAGALQKAQALLDPATPARWHEPAGWINPAALVRAWLALPGISWRGNTQVAGLQRLDAGWQLIDGAGQPLAQAQLVVVAAAGQSAALLEELGGLELQAVRGQISWAWRDAATALPPFPVNGDGHFLPDVPINGRRAWLTGSTFVRDDQDLEPRQAEHQANRQRLARLLPQVGDCLGPAFDNGSVQAWTGVRYAATDRRPLLGEVQPGLWVCTAMGSRGLTFAALCGELLAADLHGEPLPISRRLAAALQAGRQRQQMEKKEKKKEKKKEREKEKAPAPPRQADSKRPC